MEVAAAVGERVAALDALLPAEALRTGVAVLVPAEGVPLPPRLKLGETVGQPEAFCAPLKAGLLLPVGVRVGSSRGPVGAENCEGGGVAVRVGASVAVGGGLALPQLLPLPVPLCVGEAVPLKGALELAAAVMEAQGDAVLPPTLPLAASVPESRTVGNGGAATGTLRGAAATPTLRRAGASGACSHSARGKNGR